ncbi:hypothetical protein [Larkinella terrae]|uniref:Uncharacterized protein n=1 Tax=Larkinella terrae TaxID=2025311 RepID=A0A7K0EVH8_9BACT|nr:hypothetical protein [Larkinella terrae]MRS65820.1 hypothetical protein [Larkinella terrae]
MASKAAKRFALCLRSGRCANLFSLRANSFQEVRNSDRALIRQLTLFIGSSLATVRQIHYSLVSL